MVKVARPGGKSVWQSAKGKEVYLRFRRGEITGAAAAKEMGVSVISLDRYEAARLMQKRKSRTGELAQERLAKALGMEAPPAGAEGVAPDVETLAELAGAAIGEAVKKRIDDLQAQLEAEKLETAKVRAEKEALARDVERLNARFAAIVQKAAGGNVRPD